MATMTPEKRKKMEDLIYRFFTAFDPSGTNTKHYKGIFEPMTDNEFAKWFKDFFANPKAYLILNIADYENTMTLADIERAAKVLKIPLFEYVYSPYVTMDKGKIVRSKEPVAVGYINIKRTQQTVAKKNGISTNIDTRASLTAQVTGADRNGRESDLENTMLIAMGLKDTLKELNGPRSDDLVMKNQMLQDISKNGYTMLANMEDDIANKTTLNTVNTFFLGMGINTDLVTKGLMLKNTLKE